MPPPKVALAVPFYGPQSANWWAPALQFAALLGNEGVTFCGLSVSGAMMTDYNRNSIVDDLLKTDTEWIMWIDADNPPKPGMVRRLIATGKTLVSGLYISKNDPPKPIAYLKRPDGAYQPLDHYRVWDPGELLPVDATGMGCMLTHRSVFEDMQAAYVILQRLQGGLTLVHKDDLVGPVDSKARQKNDGKVVAGQLRERLIEPTVEVLRFPYFAMEYGRTEDFWFFEKAARVGHRVWLDTSVEVGHVGDEVKNGSHYRKYYGLAP